jgi:hypothetical protein
MLMVLYDCRKREPGSAEDFLGHVGLRCVLENMWPMSESLGIGFHVLAVLSDAAVETYKTATYPFKSADLSRRLLKPCVSRGLFKRAQSFMRRCASS